MTYFFKSTLFQMGFWVTWALIPICVEIIPALITAIKVVYVHLHARVQNSLAKQLPGITIIVPIYNSESTLYRCLRSISDSYYDKSHIQILVADNGSTDQSTSVYQKARNDFSNLNIQYLQSRRGKANALNDAIYMAIGKYIINIDSDGVLEKHALHNIVSYLERDQNLSAMTGTILTQKKAIQATSSWWLRLLQKNEYFEYTQAFLSGRIMEASRQELFTLSGAFSAFRRSELLKTNLYNPDTVGEDTDITYQLRQLSNTKIGFCADAIFFSEPISGLNELYTQRQRWQRGEIEVMSKFENQQANLKYFFRNFSIRRLVVDHTFVFPKMIWLFASLVLVILGYSLQTLLLSYVIIYLLYLLLGIVNFISVASVMTLFPKENPFYLSLWWCILTLPIYNFLCSWIRLIGIINSASSSHKAWTTDNFSHEMTIVKTVLVHDLQKLKRNIGYKK